MKLQVKAFIADINGLTLYLADGNTYRASNETHNIEDIISQIVVPISLGKTVEVDVESVAVFSDFNKKSSVTFYKVNGELNGFDYETNKISLTEVDHNTTVTDNLAVVSNGKIITEAEKLHKYVEDALKRKNLKGVTNLIIRLSRVIDTKAHSVSDLLKFLEDADLPITDNGTILAYKALRNTDNEDVFVDIYTGKVKQKLGTFVYTDIDYVDHDRNKECSQGLHIARRNYLRSYRGDTCFLVGISPEDVVTVPHNDANKVRVRGYVLLSKLSNEAYERLLSNESMTDLPEVATMLGSFMPLGKLSTYVTNSTHIGGPLGTNVTYEDRKEPDTTNTNSTKTKKVKAVQSLKTSNDKKSTSANKAQVAEAKKRAKLVTKVITLWGGKDNPSLTSVASKVGTSRNTVTRILKQAGLY